MNKYKLEEDLVYTLTEFYKILADNTRIKIIYALTKKDLCVNEISDIVNMSQTAVSYQLRLVEVMLVIAKLRCLEHFTMLSQVSRDTL